jgi:hypothetical protein
MACFYLSFNLILNRLINKKPPKSEWLFLGGDSAGTRTQGPYIKSVLLYQLSYEIERCFEI